MLEKAHHISLPMVAVLLLFAPALLAKASTQKAETEEWEILKDCKLVESPLNDGDSFLIEHNGNKYLFRLHYVDALETYDTYPERNEEQAQYFLIGTRDLLAYGQKGKAYTQKALSDNFTVYTRWKDARGSSIPRYFAMIETKSSYLSLELVQNGFARIYGMPTFKKWPGGFSAKAYLGILKKAEREAQKNSIGIWAHSTGSHQRTGAKFAHTYSNSQQNVLPASRRSSRTGKTNINTADLDELDTLPGIGPALAKRIVAARPIETIQSLVKISGISDTMVANLSPLIILKEPPPPPKTAFFYLEHTEEYEGKDVSVFIQSVMPIEVDSPRTFRAVRAETAYQGEEGGIIDVFIPEEYFDSFMEYYSIANREFTGLFYKHENDFVLVYRRK